MSDEKEDNCMTAPNPYVDDDTAETQETESGSSLRKFGNEQKKRADALEAELKQLKAEFAKRQVGDIFAKLGVPEKVRKFYSGEPTEDAIKAWVAENADVFGIDSNTEPTPEQTEQTQGLENVQAAQQLGQERSGPLGRDAMTQYRKDLLSREKSSMSDLEEVLRKMNVPDLPVQGPMI